MKYQINGSSVFSKCAATIALAMLAMLAGCAAVTHSPAEMQAGAATASPVPPVPRVLASQLEIEFDTGFHRTLLTGSQWQRVGSIAQGTVYQPNLDVFTLEGAHIHEAYLVVDKGTLVGFYLPAERGFSPLKRLLAIHFK